MSVENIQKFSEVVSTSPELLAKIQALQTGTGEVPAEQIVALGVEAGYPFTAEELRAAAAHEASELSEEQLETVAGGYMSKGSTVLISIFTVGIGCGIMAIDSKVKHGNAEVCMGSD